MKTDPEPAGSLQPRFDNVRGAMAGYSPTNQAPTWKNRKAFIHEMTGILSLDPAVEPRTWDEVLQDVECFLAFWRLYYCGIESAPKP